MFPSYYQAHHNRHQDDLPFWMSLAEQHDDPILELGCGTGRVTLPLAGSGHSIYGVDNDPGMLTYLSENLPSNLKSRVFFWQGNSASFRITLKFPLIIRMQRNRIIESLGIIFDDRALWNMLISFLWNYYFGWGFLGCSEEVAVPAGMIFSWIRRLNHFMDVFVLDSPWIWAACQICRQHLWEKIICFNDYTLFPFQQDYEWVESWIFLD